MAVRRANLFKSLNTPAVWTAYRRFAARQISQRRPEITIPLNDYSLSPIYPPGSKFVLKRIEPDDPLQQELQALPEATLDPGPRRSRRPP